MKKNTNKNSLFDTARFDGIFFSSEKKSKRKMDESTFIAKKL